MHASQPAVQDPAVRDPDRWALAIVQQYCYEHGYSRALEALEHEAGLRVTDEPQRGGQLLQLVYDYVERQLAAAPTDAAAARRRRLEERLLSGGSPAGPGPCPSRLRLAVQGLHAANITCIHCWPARRLAVTGSSDGGVALLSYDGALLRRSPAAASGVLCLAPHPGAASAVVAAGCMDGGVVLLDAAAGAVLARVQPHRKYVVAAAWSRDGAYLVTGAWDHSFAVHALRRRQPAPAADAAAGADAGAADAGAAGAAAAAEGLGPAAGGGWELVTVHFEQTAAKVNALLLLPPPRDDDEPGASCGLDAPQPSRSGGSSTSTFLVAVQGSNYLRRVTVTPGAGPGGAAAVAEGPPINMNPLGDDHVSFSAAHLALSPCARLLAVSADSGRLVVYEREGWSQVRSIVGLPTEQFHQFQAAFDASGSYIMAAAAHGGLAIFHVGSARRVALLAAHPKNVRGLAYDAPNNLLLTCSFDRSVRVWEAAGGPPARPAGEQHAAEEGGQPPPTATRPQAPA